MATSVLTLRADATGLAHLILTSGAKDASVGTMATLLAQKQYSTLATWAKVQSGKGLAADRASLIASDAKVLAAAS
ncbi:hypothetical protein [Actinacidiphila sp. bgisy167]|uniref:hypothetical protein n=1 Tax=Actinacidiphila sp. bgisy167 TaxID=3413797 RepID=UPI003D7043DF